MKSIPLTSRFAAFLLHFSILGLSICTAVQVDAAEPKLEHALTPSNALAKAQSKQILDAQFDAIQRQAKQQAGAHLWFAGFGLDSGSNAFRGDVDLAESKIRSVNPQLLAYKLDNQAQTVELDRPFAHLGNFQKTIKHISQQVGEKDVVVIFMSSHGNVGYLANQIGQQRYGNITAGHIKTVLQDLKDTPTVLIISACYSGSLISTLEAPNRIILTAASRSKTSWGCAPLDQNTFFIDELFGKSFDASLTLKQVFEKTEKQIIQREEALKLSHSEPQIFVGDRMRDFANETLNKSLLLTSTVTNPDAKAAPKGTQ
ncbi:C13 family peptidase [Undibacterium cyanobacteriorum]|uniref:C13 family peptidase n=1 Tax=Undibacterium cyanobacteriorum TaxID=3073561 RepID=A0ABY9RJ82_9BURK|nr:C13 family peptidase [Undibacterium sp. 20NA77.5]WMW80412.1 C13 family peptidase [Undibacterium sp. 20NA77.5]